MQLGFGVAVVSRGFTAFDGQLAERVAGVIAQAVESVGQVVAVPESGDGLGVFLEAHDVQRLDEDDDPGSQGHAKQEHRDGAGHKVALNPDVGNAELRIHENS